jgi:hypothetical protein
VRSIVVGVTQHPDGEDYSELEAKALRYLGRFSATQMAIDTAIQMLLKARLPALGPYVYSEFLARMTEDRRVKCMLKFADDVGYAGDLSSVAARYRRAKQVRDLIGHGVGLVGPSWNPQTKQRSIGIARPAGMKVNLVPEPLVPSTLERLGNDCAWISGHVYRALYESEIVKFANLTGAQPVEPEVPPLVPVNGEPL